MPRLVTPLKPVPSKLFAPGLDGVNGGERRAFPLLLWGVRDETETGGIGEFGFEFEFEFDFEFELECWPRFVCLFGERNSA